MAYSITEVVADGPITAPRWLHHVIKILTHIGAAFGLWVLFPHDAIWDAVIGGPVLWLDFAVNERLWPSDPEPLTAWQHIADWLNDSALSLVPLAGVVLAQRQLGAGVLLLGYIVITWLITHKDARP
jgi:hypothetical protein